MRPPSGPRQFTNGWVPGAVTTMRRVRAGTDGALEPPGGSVSPGPAGAGVTGEDETTLVGRGLRTLAGIFVVTWAFRLSGYLTFAPWLAGSIVELGLAGLLVVVAAWLPGPAPGSRRQYQIGWAALAAVLAALALWSYFQVFTSPGYGTDEVAFDQYAPPPALPS